MIDIECDRQIDKHKQIKRATYIYIYQNRNIYIDINR